MGRANQKSNIMSEGNNIIHVKDRETIDRALKQLKKNEKVGLLKKIRKRMFYKRAFCRTPRGAAKSHL